MNKTISNKLDVNVEVAVIGGGQAGLAAGYYLKLATIPFVIIDSNNRIGDSWRKRWDSLELFTPRPFAGLPGLKISTKYDYYPKKDEIAKYFETYVDKFKLPIMSGLNVSNVTKNKSTFVIETAQQTIFAQSIIISTGPYTSAFIPEFAEKLDKDVYQIHSSQYKNPKQIMGDTVTIVGGGNSAMQLTEELFASGKSVTLIFSKMPWFLPKTLFGISSYWWFYLTGILHSDANSPISKYVRRKGDGIIGLTAKKLIKNGSVDHRVSRVADAKPKSLILANKKRIPVSSIVWATGFKPNYDWLNLVGSLGDKGEPVQVKGISPVAGVYWIGLPWQSKMNSGIINGVSSDARLIVKRIKLIKTKTKGTKNMEEIRSKMLKGDAILLDVRTEAEWNEEHALGAIHIPIDQIESDYKLKLNPDLPIYIYCGSGKRAGVAKTFLDESGYSSINIGGLSDWKKAGGKTVKGIGL